APGPRSRQGHGYEERRGAARRCAIRRVGGGPARERRSGHGGQSWRSSAATVPVYPSVVAVCRQGVRPWPSATVGSLRHGGRSGGLGEVLNVPDRFHGGGDGSDLIPTRTLAAPPDVLRHGRGGDRSAH